MFGKQGGPSAPQEQRSSAVPLQSLTGGYGRLEVSGEDGIVS